MTHGRPSLPLATQAEELEVAAQETLLRVPLGAPLRWDAIEAHHALRAEATYLRQAARQLAILGATARPVGVDDGTGAGGSCAILARPARFWREGR